ncbi:hypothetical protein OIU77_025372 [Salix suchowensis]|uniref:Uncharacterized protein n=1 Tax=Salix suchowensis TaxID=1278906 RepID=A0ABQ9BZH1_9ROSI|nr:hypothetical protein OIU77_025372 [Salix suchowensis]
MRTDNSHTRNTGHGLTGDPQTLCKGKTWAIQSKKAQVISSHSIAHDHKDPSLAQSSLKLREGILSASRIRCATGTTVRNLMGGFSEPGMLCLPLRQFARSKQKNSGIEPIYPTEPYELNPSTQQSSFYYQLNKPTLTSMTDIKSPYEKRYLLEEAVARYKGFLYLIKRNQGRSIKHFCVPTYDIDLIWHSHQLHPVSYCKDLVAIIGRVLEHDDTDSDTGRQELCIEGILHLLSKSDKNDTASDQYQSIIQLPEKTLIEVMVEIVEVRDLPAEHDGGLSVILGKKRPDLYFNGRRMSILSKAGKRDVAVFRCEPTGELIFKFLSYPSFVSHIASPARMLGTTSISLYDLMKTGSPLSIEKWFALMPISGIIFNENGGQRQLFSQKGSDRHDQLRRNLLLAEFAGTGWSLMNSSWWFQPRKKNTCATRIFELTGSHKAIVFPGRKLEYEIKCENYKHEQNFMIAVKFSAEYPHGKAVALFDLKSASLKVNEEWVGFPGILLAFLLSDTSRNGQFNTDGESAKQMGNDSEQYANTSSEEDKTTSQIQDMEDTAKSATQEPCKSGDKCDCGVVAQVEVMGGKGSGDVKNITGEENYSNGSKAVINGGQTPLNVVDVARVMVVVEDAVHVTVAVAKDFVQKGHANFYH